MMCVHVNLLLKQMRELVSVPHLVGYKLKMGASPPWLVVI